MSAKSHFAANSSQLATVSSWPESVDHERLLYSATIYIFANGSLKASQLIGYGTSLDPFESFTYFYIAADLQLSRVIDNRRPKATYTAGK